MTQVQSSPVPPESTLAVACLLSLSGGFLDAFTYVGHGKVFANAMTGNIVLMGVSAGIGDWPQAVRHVPPIAAFLAGVCVAEAFRRSGARWPALSSLLLEMVFLAVMAFLPRSFPDIWIVLGIAFAGAVQNSSFTHVGDKPYNSVLTTANLRRFAESLFAGAVTIRDPALLAQARTFGAICLCFLTGALAGGLATGPIGNAALSAPVAILAIAFLLCRRSTAP